MPDFVKLNGIDGAIDGEREAATFEIKDFSFGVENPTDTPPEESITFVYGKLGLEDDSFAFEHYYREAAVAPSDTSAGLLNAANTLDFKAMEESEGVGKPNPGKLNFEHYYDTSSTFDGDGIDDLATYQPDTAIIGPGESFTLDPREVGGFIMEYAVML